MSTKWYVFTPGVDCSSWPMAAVSWSVTVGLRKMASSTPPRHWMAALLMAWRATSTAPSTVSDTVMATTAARVITRLRRRLPHVSRAT